MPRRSEGDFRDVPEGMDPLHYVLKVCEAIGKKYGNATIARDLHPTSPMVSGAVIAGLTSVGAEVRDGGVMPSPVLPFASKSAKCTIMIGSPVKIDRQSHINLRNPDGTFVDAEACGAIRDRIDKGVELPDYKKVGCVRPVTGGIDRYKDRVMSAVLSANCQVIMDCASDCPSYVAPQMLTDLGADVVSVNSHPGGKSPVRHPSPDELNLGYLAKTVKANPGSLGLAFNSDGSRLAAYDEAGRYMDGAAIFATIIDVFRPPKVAAPIDAPMIIDYLMGQDNVIRIPRGVSGLGAAVRDTGLKMGSDCAGSFVFADVSYALDGMAAGAYLAKAASETSLRQLLDAYPETVTGGDFVKFPWDNAKAAKALSENLLAMDRVSFSDVDGFRVGMESGWFHVRPGEAGAEIVAEAKDKMYLAGMIDLAKRALDASSKVSR